MSKDLKSWLKWLSVLLAASLLLNILFFGLLTPYWSYVFGMTCFQMAVFSLLMFIQISIEL